jgi:hypothetical protein
MVLLVTENWWPANKSAEVGKKYLEAMKKYPDDKSVEKPILRSAVWTTCEGMHSITVSSVLPGKVKEVMDIAYNRLLMLSIIEGYRFEIHVAYDLAEGMPLIGLSAPKE